MANSQAIMAVCEGIRRWLETAYKNEGRSPVFAFDLNLPRHSSQSAPVQNTVFLSLYRVSPNSSHHTPIGRNLLDEKRQRNQLPIDLHFLLTIRCEDSVTQQITAGWMMRVLEDRPILPASHLNEGHENVFRPDEIIVIGLSELSVEDMSHLWKVLTDSKYYLSIPYVVRNLRIESGLPASDGKPIRETQFKA